MAGGGVGGGGAAASPTRIPSQRKIKPRPVGFCPSAGKLRRGQRWKQSCSWRRERSWERENAVCAPRLPAGQKGRFSRSTSSPTGWAAASLLLGWKTPIKNARPRGSGEEGVPTLGCASAGGSRRHEECHGLAN